MSRLLPLLLFLVIVALTTGCIGQSKATGKFSNQDKPKPAESK